MKRFTLVFITLLFVLSAGPLNSPVFAKDTWLSVRSKNFLLVGNGNEKQIRQVAVRLEQFREVFAQLFPKAAHGTPVPTTVIVFNSDELDVLAQLFLHGLKAHAKSLLKSL